MHSKTNETKQGNNDLILPLSVVSKVDISRIIREVVSVDDFLVSAGVREPGSNVKLPKTSRLMDDIFELNKLNPLVKEDRQRLMELLEKTKKEAPQIHLSFNSNPSQIFIQRIMEWLRAEINPNLMLKIGLQPGIGAGVIVRTTNKYFDFSLRQRFSSKKDILLNKLRAKAVTNTNQASREILVKISDESKTTEPDKEDNS